MTDGLAVRAARRLHRELAVHLGALRFVVRWWWLTWLPLVTRFGLGVTERSISYEHFTLG